MTAFVGSHARRDALQLIQAFWEALGMSTSVSKTGNTGSQHSCTVVPSHPSKGGCVSCPPDTICCLFMVVSRSVKHVVTCLQCVLLRQERHPALWKVSLLLQPWVGAALSSPPSARRLQH